MRNAASLVRSFLERDVRNRCTLTHLDFNPTSHKNQLFPPLVVCFPPNYVPTASFTNSRMTLHMPYWMLACALPRELRKQLCWLLIILHPRYAQPSKTASLITPIVSRCRPTCQIPIKTNQIQLKSLLNQSKPYRNSCNRTFEHSLLCRKYVEVAGSVSQTFQD